MSWGRRAPSVTRCMQRTHRCTAKSCNTEVKMCQRGYVEEFTSNWTLPAVLSVRAVREQSAALPSNQLFGLMRTLLVGKPQQRPADPCWSSSRPSVRQLTVGDTKQVCCMSYVLTRSWEGIAPWVIEKYNIHVNVSKQAQPTPGGCCGSCENRRRVSPEWSWRTYSCVYLCVDQCVVEQNEPVVRESSSVLQSQGSSAAALTDHSSSWKTQTLLMDKK